MAVITDLVAYYSLDEASGNAIDAHGANDLTDTNTVGAASGKVSGARDFENGSDEDFVIADNADMSLGADTPFTWAGWAYNEQDFQASTDILAKGTAGNGMAYCVYISGGFRFSLLVGNGSSNQTVSDNTVFPTPAGTWFFIVAKHDPVANLLKIKVNDGTEVTAAWSGGTQNEGGSFYLGSSNGENVVGWDGLLDEWGFWKKVTSDSEDTWLYNSGSGRSYADIVAEAGGGRTTKNTRAFPLGMNVGMGFGIGGL
jgi:hypothetical protein